MKKLVEYWNTETNIKLDDITNKDMMNIMCFDNNGISLLVQTTNDSANKTVKMDVVRNFDEGFKDSLVLDYDIVKSQINLDISQVELPEQNMIIRAYASSIEAVMGNLK